MSDFGLRVLHQLVEVQKKSCEFCERDGFYEPCETLCHGIWVCIKHIEAANAEWARQGA